MSTKIWNKIQQQTKKKDFLEIFYSSDSSWASNGSLINLIVHPENLPA